jgi:membrane protein DedA with SNARE-associated domain
MLARLVELLAGNSLDIGYVFVFVVLLLCGFGLPMPEDVILVTGGVLAWLASDLDKATLSSLIRDRGLVTMVVVGLSGILAGDTCIFLAGRRFGHRVADFGPLRRVITPAKLELVEKKVRRRGNVMVVFARFLPGLRAPTFFTVGHARMPLWEFLLFDGAAALVSAPLWVCLGFWFGSDLEEAARVAARFSHYILLAVAVVILALVARWLQGRREGRGSAAPPGIAAAERRYGGDGATAAGERD